MIKTFVISTDAIFTLIKAEDINSAVKKFSNKEKVYENCNTAKDVLKRANDLGGWANVYEIELSLKEK